MAYNKVCQAFRAVATIHKPYVYESFIDEKFNFVTMKYVSKPILCADK